MSSAKDFSINISKFVEKSKLAPTQVLRKIAFDLFSAVLKRTPVDTGMLRSNWQVGIGVVPTSKVSAASKSPVAGQQEMLAKLENAQWGTSIYFVNNLPYASVVEYGGFPDPVKRGTYVPAGKNKYGIRGPGWVQRSANGFSKQAPSGMVRVSLAETKAYLERIVSKSWEPLT